MSGRSSECRVGKSSTGPADRRTTDCTIAPAAVATMALRRGTDHRDRHLVLADETDDAGGRLAGMEGVERGAGAAGAGGDAVEVGGFLHVAAEQGAVGPVVRSRLHRPEHLGEDELDVHSQGEADGGGDDVGLGSGPVQADHQAPVP